MNDDQVRIYVPFVDEGVEVWRPVDTELVSESVYRISDIPEPSDEQWQFTRGQLVRCEQRRFSDGQLGLAAVQRANG